MPTFIDESGDTGSIEDGGKPYFRLVAVWVATHDEADRFRERVRRLRHELGLKADYEFKYTKMHQPAHRRAFFDAAMSCEFRFAVGSVDKTDARWNAASRADQH